MAEKFDRPILATVFRKNAEVTRRHYACLETAIRRMTEHAIIDGEPRDVVEISHKATGLQIGTIKVGVGKLTTAWVWDETVGLNPESN